MARPVEKIECRECRTGYPPTLLMRGMCSSCRASHEDEFAERLEREERQKVRELEDKIAQKKDRKVKAQAIREAKKNFNAVEFAKAEQAQRELSRRHLLPFIQRFNPDYMAGWVHTDICIRLERFVKQVENCESPRLIITLPPRSGKSEIVSRTLPAWVLGHYPTWEFILSSYSGSLSDKFSKSVRGIVRDKLYQNIFKTRLPADSQGVQQWNTTEGGGLMSAGVGGALTGNGAHILLIDDPVKNREEAESPSTRASTWDWYTSTAYTRLAPGGGMLICQTRWHEDDLAGRLITKMKEASGDDFEVVNYPAVALENEKYRKAGEALHPERYNLKALGNIRRAIGERDWWALYQQKPVSDEGAYFKRADFRYFRFTDLPPSEDLVYYQAWDLAIGTKEANDYTVGGTVALDRDNRLYLIDVRRFKEDGDYIVEEIINMWRDHEAQITGIEKGQIEMAIGPFLERRIRERNAWGLNIEGLKTGRRDKAARARPIQAMMRAGMLHIPHESEAVWVKDFVSELLRFSAGGTAGTHDDQVDMIAWIGQMITSMAPAPKLPEAKKKSWKDKLGPYIVSDNTTKNWRAA